MTVRDVRQRWPEAERSLAEEGVMMDSLSGLLTDREERVLVSEAALKAVAEEDDQEDRNGEDLKSDSKP